MSVPKITCPNCSHVVLSDGQKRVLEILRKGPATAAEINKTLGYKQKCSVNNVLEFLRGMGLATRSDDRRGMLGRLYSVTKKGAA